MEHNSTEYYEVLLSRLPEEELSISQIGLPEYRTVFMRDRDRILYSRPFLRLSGKTQIYSAGYDDHARNRLTHSLEVSQIARTIAHALSLDTNLTEAIALGHDVGHTPFGHAGERELDDILNYENTKIINKLFGVFLEDIPGVSNIPDFFCATKQNAEFFKLKEYSDLINKNRGFKHNWQGVRVLTDLSRNYLNGNMNLTSLTRSGILFHSKLCYKHKNKEALSFYERYQNNLNNLWCIEGLVVAIADEIAQRHHDIEDALACHYLLPKRVLEILSEAPTNEELEEVRDENFDSAISSKSPATLIMSESDINDLDQNKENADLFLSKLSSFIVNGLVSDVIETNRSIISPKSLKDILATSHSDVEKYLLGFSKRIKFADKIIQIRFKKVILNSRNVQRMDNRGRYIIRKLFEAYVSEPKQMPDNTLNAVFREFLRQKNIELERIDDYFLFKDSVECRDYFDFFFNVKKNGKSRNISGNEVFVDSFHFRICLMRVIADYISGMTDSYAEEEFRKLYGIVHDIDA